MARIWWQIWTVRVRASHLPDRHGGTCLEWEDRKVSLRDRVQECPELCLPVEQLLGAIVGKSLTQGIHQRRACGVS